MGKMPGLSRASIPRGSTHIENPMSAGHTVITGLWAARLAGTIMALDPRTELACAEATLV